MVTDHGQVAGGNGTLEPEELRCQLCQSQVAQAGIRLLKAEVIITMTLLGGAIRM